MAHKYLFLHMGPGLNAQAERNQFAASYPDVLFWDQPAQTDPQTAFEKLTQSAHEQIDQLFSTAQSPVGLISHSFSGQLILSLLKTVDPQKIESCTLLCPEFYFENSFINLLKKLPNKQNLPKDIQDEISDFLHKVPTLNAVEKFNQGLQLVIKTPDFFKLYWHDQNDYLDYTEKTKHNTPIDFTSFTSISTSLLTRLHKKAAISFSGKVNIYLGAQDPLIDLDAELKAWKTVFPQAQIHILNNCGHFAHFEKKTLFI